MGWKAPTIMIAIGALALAGCAGAAPSRERDAERCREAGYQPGSPAFAQCTAGLESERERATRSVLNTIPIRGYGP